MIAALRYEWVRISTVRSTRIVLVLTVLASAGLAFLIALPRSAAVDESGNVVESGAIDWYAAFGFPLSLAAIFASILAAQAIGQEYRFGVIRLTFTAFPKRSQVLVAKLVAVVASSVVVVLLSFLGSEIGVALRGHPVPPAGVESPDSTYLLRGAVYVVLWALSAFALAGITRQTAVGIAVPLISGLIVEPLLGAALSDRAYWLTQHLPWSTGARWFQEPGSESFDGSPNPPVGWEAIEVFGLWVLVLLAVECVVLLRRDA